MCGSHLTCRDIWLIFLANLLIEIHFSLSGHIKCSFEPLLSERLVAFFSRYWLVHKTQWATYVCLNAIIVFVSVTTHDSRTIMVLVGVLLNVQFVSDVPRVAFSVGVLWLDHSLTRHEAPECHVLAPVWKDSPFLSRCGGHCTWLHCIWFSIISQVKRRLVHVFCGDCACFLDGFAGRWFANLKNWLSLVIHVDLGTAPNALCPGRFDSLRFLRMVIDVILSFIRPWFFNYRYTKLLGESLEVLTDSLIVRMSLYCLGWLLGSYTDLLMITASKSALTFLVLKTPYLLNIKLICIWELILLVRWVDPTLLVIYLILVLWKKRWLSFVLVGTCLFVLLRLGIITTLWWWHTPFLINNNFSVSSLLVNQLFNL